eukprot:ctg_6300.g457
MQRSGLPKIYDLMTLNTIDEPPSSLNVASALPNTAGITNGAGDIASAFRYCAYRTPRERIRVGGKT